LNLNYGAISSFFINKNILSSFWITYGYKDLYDDLIHKITGIEHEYDLILSTQYPSPSIMFGDIAYFHYPDIISMPLETRYIPDSNPFIRLYKLFLRLVEFRALSKMMAEEVSPIEILPKVFIAGSTWTKNGLIRIYSRLEALGLINISKAAENAYVIYEPIDYETYASKYDPKTKENLVLTVSRYAPRKNLWSIIQIASQIPGTHFIIAGSTKTAGSSKVLHELESLMDKFRIRNVTLEKDVPKRKLIDYYVKAKVYLHPLYIEHFGISIAEGAAAGAVPVVYRDGGGWLDIASRIHPSLGYTNIREAAHVVRTLLHDDALWLKLSRKSVEITRDLSWDNYKMRLKKSIEETLTQKRILNHS